MRNLLSDLSIFIDPVTGLLPLEEGYIFEGSVDGVGMPSASLIDIKKAILGNDKLTYGRIWRGNADGIREESNALFEVEQSIAFIQNDTLSLGRRLTGTTTGLGAVVTGLSALEVNLRSQDLILTTPSTLFPLAQSLSNKGAGLMFLAAAGQIRTQPRLDIGSLPPLGTNRVFIGNARGEVVTKSMDDYKFLPDLGDEEIAIGINKLGRKEVIAKLPSNFTKILDREEADVLAVGTSGFRKSNLKTKGDGSLSVASITLDEQNNYISSSVTHKADNHVSRVTTYLWGVAGEDGQVLHIKDRGKLYWKDVELPSLRKDYIFIGGDNNKAKEVSPSDLPFGDGYLINTSDIFTSGVERLQRTDIKVTKEGGLTAIGIKLRNNYGGSIEHKVNSLSGGTASYTWPTAKSNGYLKCTDSTGGLEWSELNLDIPLVLSSPVQGYNKAQVLNRLGVGITKLDVSGKFSVAKEGADYPSVKTVDSLGRDSRKHGIDINKNSASLKQQGIRLTTLNTRVSALNIRTTALDARVSINTGQIAALWAALQAAAYAGVAGVAVAGVFGGLFGGIFGGRSGGNTYNTNGISAPWVINYVNQRFHNIKSSDSIDVVIDPALQYPKYTISVKDSYIDGRIIDKAKIRFFSAGISVSSFSIGENIVILN